MNKLANTLVVALLALSCGDNKLGPDAGVDAAKENPAPALGAQIDRLGRPAINTAMNGILLSGAPKAAQKDAYNSASDPAAWATTEVATGVTVVQEFAKHAALFDIIDQGVANIVPSGCGNSALYQPPASTSSYTMLATVLADDELYVDTTKSTCLFYLSLEVEVASGGGVLHTQCGGRTLSHDVGDFSYSLLAAGTKGFDAANGFAPRIGDGVAKHADVDDAVFPFLGAPH